MLLKNKLQTLIEEYKKEAGQTNFAVRDLLTDLFHLGDDLGFNLKERLESAEEVYNEEVFEEDRARTNDWDEDDGIRRVKDRDRF